MKYIVTGCAGFIGSHLTDELLAQGHTVLGVDNMANGKIENLAGALANDNFMFSKHDVCGFDWGPPLRFQIDGIFHLAAMGSVPRSWSMPTIYHHNNTDALVELLAFMHQNGIKIPVVFASSSSVYGNSDKQVKSEDDPLRPLSPYAVTKASCEAWCKTFAERGGFNVSALRFFNVFGPRQRHDIPNAAVVPAVAKKILLGQNVDIYGASVARDFTPVNMVVDACIEAMNRTEGQRFEIFNVGRGVPVSLREIYELIVKACHPFYFSGVTFHEPKAGEILYSKASTKKIKGLLKERFDFYNQKQFEGTLCEAIKRISLDLISS